MEQICQLGADIAGRAHGQQRGAVYPVHSHIGEGARPSTSPCRPFAPGRIRGHQPALSERKGCPRTKLKSALTRRASARLSGTCCNWISAGLWASVAARIGAMGPDHGDTIRPHIALILSHLTSNISVHSDHLLHPDSPHPAAPVADVGAEATTPRSRSCWRVDAEPLPTDFQTVVGTSGGAIAEIYLDSDPFARPSIAHALTATRIHPGVGAALAGGIQLARSPLPKIHADRRSEGIGAVHPSRTTIPNVPPAHADAGGNAGQIGDAVASTRPAIIRSVAARDAIEVGASRAASVTTQSHQPGAGFRIASREAAATHPVEMPGPQRQRPPHHHQSPTRW